MLSLLYITVSVFDDILQRLKTAFLFECFHCLGAMLQKSRNSIDHFCFDLFILFFPE